MTQVAQIFEEEKQRALTQAAQAYEEEKKETLTQVVLRMIQKGYSSEEIAMLVPYFSQSDVEALREKMMD